MIAWDMGHVSGLEKYEFMIWKVCMSLSRIDDGSMWCLWMRVVVGGGWFMSWKWFDISIDERRGSSMAMSCTGGERVWVSMGL